MDEIYVAELAYQAQLLEQFAKLTGSLSPETLSTPEQLISALRECAHWSTSIGCNG